MNAFPAVVELIFLLVVQHVQYDAFMLLTYTVQVPLILMFGPWAEWVLEIFRWLTVLTCVSSRVILYTGFRDVNVTRTKAH